MVLADKIRTTQKILLEMFLSVKDCLNVQCCNPRTGTHLDHTRIISLPEPSSHGDSRATLQYPYGNGFCGLDQTLHPF